MEQCNTVARVTRFTVIVAITFGVVDLTVNGDHELHISDYYWQVSSPFEWINVIFSNDCNYIDQFIKYQLIPMNPNIMNIGNESLILDYFGCTDIQNNSVHVARDTCFYTYSSCLAYQHFMFEISKNASNYSQIKSDSIVDSLLNI